MDIFATEQKVFGYALQGTSLSEQGFFYFLDPSRMPFGQSSGWRLRKTSCTVERKLIILIHYGTSFSLGQALAWGWRQKNVPVEHFLTTGAVLLNSAQAVASQSCCYKTSDRSALGCLHPYKQDKKSETSCTVKKNLLFWYITGRSSAW